MGSLVLPSGKVATMNMNMMQVRGGGVDYFEGWGRQVGWLVGLLKSPCVGLLARS
jgi:hypothetical protein